MRTILVIVLWAPAACTSENGGAPPPIIEETSSVPATAAPATAAPGPATPAPATAAPGSASAEPASAAAPAAPTDELMREVRRLLKRGDREGLAKQVGIDGPIVVTITESLGEGRPDRTRLLTADDVGRWLREMTSQWGPPCRANPPADSCAWMNGLHILSRIECEGDCCSHTHDELTHNTLFLDKICFESSEGGALRIRSIDFTDGG